MNLRLFFLMLCSIWMMHSWAISYNEMMLPDRFNVYTDGNGARSSPAGSLQKVSLPTNNKYTGTPGCYIACYSRKGDEGVYKVANDIYVIGQIHVAGVYNQRNCVPLGTVRQDISKGLYFKKLCGDTFPACADNRCWAGGDTGGWLGIIPR